MLRGGGEQHQDGLEGGLQTAQVQLCSEHNPSLASGPLTWAFTKSCQMPTHIIKLIPPSSPAPPPPCIGTASVVQEHFCWGYCGFQ